MKSAELPTRRSVSLLVRLLALLGVAAPTMAITLQPLQGGEYDSSNIALATRKQDIHDQDVLTKTDLGNLHPSKYLEDNLRRKGDVVSADLTRSTLGVSKNVEIILALEKELLEHQEPDYSRREVDKILLECEKRHGKSCSSYLSRVKSNRAKRDAQTPDTGSEATNVSSPSTGGWTASKQDAEKKNESVTQFVFRELQNLLYNSRSQLQESKEVKFLDEVHIPTTQPSQTEFFGDLSSYTKTGLTYQSNPQKIKRTKLAITTPAKENSVPSSGILQTKFLSSTPKTRFDEFSHRPTAIAATTDSLFESEKNLPYETELHFGEVTKPNGRYTRSTTSSSASFFDTKRFSIPTPGPILVQEEVSNDNGDFVIDYIAADYETLHPQLTLQEILSKKPLPYIDVMTPSTDTFVDGLYYEEQDYPLHEYFVISEHLHSEYSSLPLFEKQVFEETQVPVKFLEGKGSSLTHLITTTPLSNDEIYHIVTENIPETSTTIFRKPTNAPEQIVQRRPTSELHTKSQSTTGTSTESPYASTGSTNRSEFYTKFAAQISAAPYNPEADITTQSYVPLKSESEQIRPPSVESVTTLISTSTISNSADPPSRIPSKPTTENVDLTTTLQDLVTAIQSQLGTPSGVANEQRTDSPIPMQVTVTSDELTVSGPDTQSISSILEQLRKPVLSLLPPHTSFVRPNYVPYKGSDVGPVKFSSVTSGERKNLEKPSVTSLFADDPVISSVSFKTISGPDEVTSNTKTSSKLNEQTGTAQNIKPTNSYGIPESLIESEILKTKLKPDVTPTHIFGIPKYIIEMELQVENKGKTDEPTNEASGTYHSKINLSDNKLIRYFNDSDDIGVKVINGLPLSVLNAELRKSNPGNQELYYVADVTDANEWKRQEGVPPDVLLTQALDVVDQNANSNIVKASTPLSPEPASSTQKISENSSGFLTEFIASFFT
ncbi:uncharacterized protein LOC108678865 [Hyalella azteca]|uniref:Uncharacterized protein LOC108678865 n=1 Tax=Hyalella azteca TaxID=294128 RepID=A0A8B7P9L9_HYAAZ|nr:uncharacterized protein LOC108678865 [Hyalella azteca]